jgi:hypothetical protein
MSAAPDRAHRLDDDGLPRLSDPLLDALMSIARADGRLPRHALHQQALAALLGRDLVVGCGHDLVELTPLGCASWPMSAWNGSASRPHAMTGPALESESGGLADRGRAGVRWRAGAACRPAVHHTAATSARIRAIRHRSEQDPTR